MTAAAAAATAAAADTTQNKGENGDQQWDFVLNRLASNASKHPSKVAMAFLTPGPNGGKLSKQNTFTYQQLEQETSALATRLLESGMVKGDRAVLVYPPSLDFIISFLACLKVGIVAVPVFPPNPLRRDTLYMFSRIVQGCNAKFALTSQEYNHAKKIGGIRDAFTRNTAATATATASWPESLQWIVTDQKSDKTTAVSTSSSSSSSSSPCSSSDLAFLQYTSGSTSEPKGVMITHGNLAHNLSIITAELKADCSTIVVSWLPQYHDMGLIGSYLGILYCGGTGYYMSPLSFLQRPMLWMEACSKYRATHLQAPNFSFKLTARKFQADKYTVESLKLSSVKHVINAAEPIDEVSIETFYKTFGPFGFGKVIFPTYGLAEHCVFVCSGGKQRLTVLKRELEVDGKVTLAPTSTPSTASTTSTADVSRLVGCGYPARQGVDVKIVDTESFKAVMEDVVGEIWIHSPSKAAGYFHKPEETKHDFHAVLADSEATEIEYLRTGDLGFLHQGELFICGRLKDLIIVGGRNYYPQDIEGTAEASSDLVRLGCSAAFTIDTTRQGGEEVALVMELKEVPTSKQVESVCVPLANQIRASINQEHSLGITEIVFLQPRSVPKTSSGKIARAWCRKGFVAGTLKVVYRKSFKSNTSFLEIEPTEDGSPGSTKCSTSRPAMSAVDVESIRAMSKEVILGKLASDAARAASIPLDSIDKKAALVTMMDSITLSQFKGLLESHYAVKISDEYLFRESTTLTKLAEVVKLGYAPDDDADANANADGSGAPLSNAPSSSAPGTAGGCAGALGCPPGVVCTIL